MTETTINEQNAAFLLGKLTEEEGEDIELGFFENANSFEGLLMTESELTDAYVSGRLSPEDRVLFQNRLLISQRQEQRALFAETLVRYATSLPADVSEQDVSTSKPVTFFSRLFSIRPVFSISFAAAAAMILFLGAIWLTLNRTNIVTNGDVAKSPASPAVEPGIDRSGAQLVEEDNAKKGTLSTLEPNPSNPERASDPGTDRPLPRRKAARTDSLPASIATIILPLGMTRGSETTRTFVLPLHANSVNLQMEFETGAFSSFFAVVETVDGQQVWRGRTLSPIRKVNAKTVTITVPARRLPKGDYVVSLKGSTSDRAYQSIGDYAFTIDRR